MTEIVHGSKYAATKNLSRVEIAKLIRLDIKAAVASKALPKAKYSVTTERYAGGGSIDIRISKIEGIKVFDEAALLHFHDDKNATTFFGDTGYSKETKAALAKLNEIHNSYNFDGSDSQSDYFHVRYYGTVHLDWQDADATRNEETAKAVTARDLAVAMKVEADYIAREAEKGNPEILALLTDAEVYTLAVERAAEQGIIPIPAPRHLSLVPPITKTVRDLDEAALALYKATHAAALPSEEPDDYSHVAYLVHLGVH